MTTAKSSFSLSRMASIYKAMLLRYRNAAIFYILLGFFFLSAQYLMTMLNQDESFLYEGVYSGVSMFFFSAVCMIASLAFACAMLSYMHNRRSTDFFHSLPITRQELFFSICAAGLTIIWGGIIINFGAMMIMSLVLKGGAIAAMAVQMLNWLAASLAIFAITAFCSVQLGTVFDTVAYSLVLMASLSLMLVVISVMCNSFLYGYSDQSHTLLELAYRLCPVSVMIGSMSLMGVSEASAPGYHFYNDLSMTLWAVAAIALLILGAFIYSRRRSETAEQVGNMGPLQIYARSVGTFVCGTALGAILWAVFSFSGKVGLILCIGIGSLIVYFVGDVILSRTVRSLKKSLPAALITAVAVCLVSSVIIFDMTGFSTRVPSISSVESIEISYRGRYSGEYPYGRRSDITITDPEAMQLIIDAHNYQIEQGDNYDDYYYGNIDISYNLASGGTMRRSYSDVDEGTLLYLGGLESNDEFISQVHPVFQIEPENLRGAFIWNIVGDAQESISPTGSAAEELIEALRTDLLSQPQSEFLGNTEGLCYITLEYAVPESLKNAAGVSMATPESASGEYTYFTEVLVTESFQNTIALLEDLGLSDVLQNELPDASQIMIGLMPYIADDTAVYQTSHDMIYAASELRDTYAILETGEARTLGISLTDEQLDAIRPYLTNILPVERKSAVVGIFT